MLRRCLPRLRTGESQNVQFTVIKDVKVQSTNYPTIFTLEPLEPVVALQEFQPVKQKIFACGACFVPPKDLKFALPREGKAEIAFIGRSNVGKSSLIDRLLTNAGQGQGLVRISKQAGCTKTINFFTFIRGTQDIANNKNAMEATLKNIPEHDTSSHIAYFVDMPGYGYARADKSEKSRWEQVLDSYLLVRNQSVLRRVFILVDSRHGLKDSDIEMMDILNGHRIAYQLIMTKTDLVKENEFRAKLHHAFQVMLTMKNNSCMPFIHAVSAVKNEGIDTLKLSIAETLSHKWGSHNSWIES